MRAYVQAGGRDDDECARGHFVQVTAHLRKEKMCIVALHRVQAMLVWIGCSLRLVVLRVELSVEDLAHQPRQ